MYRDNIPLPEKVLLTGEGYTLSGKPLDPNSAAAKPYLKSMSIKVENGSNEEKQTTKEEPKVSEKKSAKKVVEKKAVEKKAVEKKTVEKKSKLSNTDL